LKIMFLNQNDGTLSRYACCDHKFSLFALMCWMMSSGSP
jgi:hypothetical protein